jgi:hypothetical protein
VSLTVLAALLLFLAALLSTLESFGVRSRLSLGWVGVAVAFVGVAILVLNGAG